MLKFTKHTMTSQGEFVSVVKIFLSFSWPIKEDTVFRYFSVECGMSQKINGITIYPLPIHMDELRTDLHHSHDRQMHRGESIEPQTQPTQPTK